MSHKPFKSASLAYNEIHKYLNSLAPGDVRSIVQIWNALSPSPNMKNIIQVTEALKIFYAKGYVCRTREGKAFMYWANKNIISSAEYNTTASAVREYTTEPKYDLPAVTLAHLEMPLKTAQKHEVPHVTITDTCITVIHNKYKLTLELS
ncbi:hypothetical protein [Methylotenera sp.]|uniref:hypothetical protein n=1 Tax=Methylotenera sp. TaxID=2051956 RepID=UPI002733D6D5|nr:hypothetical protein [Methylotenera sp.]MDP3308292.1 hypothetical protein [Methylotenera sp.]